MALGKFRPGDRVRFRGKLGADGRVIFANEEGPDEIVATIAGDVMGLCWILQYDDGYPVGIPFQDFQLEAME